MTAKPEVSDISMHENRALPFAEFVTLMALMMALVALSIDAMLPALGLMGDELKVANSNDTQLVVSTMFLGMGIGQLFYGSISDSFGRKPAMCIGVGLFIVGCLMSLWSTDFEGMLIGRLLQGIGLGAPRILTMAIIRDQYRAESMARVLSFVMSVFILVPMVAPLLGQGVLLLAGWRAIFALLLGVGLLSISWFIIRQPETLPLKKRAAFSVKQISMAFGEVLTNRIAVGYTLASGFISGAFIAYLSTVQQILQQQYALGQLFPLYFAGLAMAIGSAYFANGHLVMRYGMRLLSALAVSVQTVTAVVFFGLAFMADGHPPLWLLLCFLALMLFCTGVLFGNVSAMAMTPLGHMAGVGASVVGALGTLISVPTGITIGRYYDGTVLPLVVGYAVCGLAAIVMMVCAEPNRLKA